MSGQAGARGYLVQSLICVINSIDDRQWHSLSIEPNLASDKVDVIWYYSDRTKVVQIKHSQNQITWAMVKTWAEELEKSIQVEEYELQLIGPCNKEVASTGLCGKVSIPTPHALNFEALIEQAAHKLDKYLEFKNILKFTSKQRELIIEALTTKLSVYSTTGSKVSREDLDKLLVDWAKETDQRAITAATNHQALELQAKDKVEDTLTWLRQNMTASYMLLCRSSVYRRPVPESFWLEMLMGFASNEKAYALKTLKRRGIVEEEVTGNGQSLLHLPERIKTGAYELLGQIGKKVAHEIAVRMWRTAYEPEPDAPNLEKVRGYLEAFHHLCELEDWKSAKDILTVRLKPTDDELHIQLDIWGYYQERIYLYSRLLGKLNSSFDSVFLKGLGNTYQAQGNYYQAINYHQQDLLLTQEIGNRAGEAKAWGNLGIAYKSLADFAQALECHQQNLAIAREIGDRAGEGAAFCNLGNVYYEQGYWSEALEYYQQDLSITREIGDRAREGAALGRIGNIYYNQEDLVKAIEYHQQNLTINRDMGDLAGEGAALGHMGNVYHRRGDLAEALKYYQQCLTIAQVIGDLAGEETALCNLGNVYSSKGDLKAALEYRQQALTIARQIGDRVGEGRILYNSGLTLIKLKQDSQALISLQSALEIVREVNAHYIEVRTLASLAEFHQKLDQCDLAVEFCDQALAIATKLRMPIAKDCQQLKEKLLSEKVS
jgi:tetratricopeptide (TPR) repeat protein